MLLSRKVLTYGVDMDCLGELLPGAGGKPEACCFLHSAWSCQMMELTDLLTAQHQFFQLLAAAQKAKPARTMLGLAHAYHCSSTSASGSCSEGHPGLHKAPSHT